MLGDAYKTTRRSRDSARKSHLGMISDQDYATAETEGAYSALMHA